MKQKQILKLAAIVNAVLLVVLMLTAKRGHERVEEPSLASQVRGQSQKVPIPSQKSSKVIATALSIAPAPKLDFAKELEAIKKATQEKKPLNTRSESTRQNKVNQVIVEQGDALEKIARHHKTTVNQLIEVNNLKTTSLQIGQVLKLPSQANSVEGRFYTVKSGDNPWTIAEKNKIKVDQLLKLNNLTEQKARNLRPGDQLRIR